MSVIKTKSKHFWQDFTVETISAGILAAIFGCVATSLIIINSGELANLPTDFTISWLSSVWFFGGILGIIMAFVTKQPISGAWSIPAAVLLGTTLQTYSIPQAVGAYFLSGVLVFILGVSGIVNKIIKFLPMPIIMAMIAGALMRFAIGIISGIQALPVISGITVITYFISRTLWPKVSPVIPSLLIGIALSITIGGVDIDMTSVQFLPMQIILPEFSFNAFIAISIPITILVIGAENAQATGVLMSEGYTPPVKQMTILSGIGGMIVSFFGGHNANIAGPMTAICSSDIAGEHKEKRYTASILCGVICATFGFFASYAINFIKLIPAPLVTTIAGMAMINVLLQALQGAFNNKENFQFASFFAFIIALSNMTLFNITAPFWSLVIGVGIAIITERDAFFMNNKK